MSVGVNITQSEAPARGGGQRTKDIAKPEPNYKARLSVQFIYPLGATVLC